jgi:oligopeptide/dipeptide ABC transporter ATP-binding protein
VISDSPKLVEVDHLKTYFPIRGGVFRQVTNYVKAVDDVSLTVNKGAIVSIVGESGCGKTTLGLSILGLVPMTSGSIRLDGESVNTHRLSSWNRFRKDFQIVFQDPYSSLNPRHTVFEILSEPLLAHKICSRRTARDEVAALLQKVGLEPDYMKRFPHAFSGGQRQRIGIARAIGLRPKLIVCDEVVAALDVSVQAQIIQLLLDLKKDLSLSLLFISHDLALVKTISDYVHVMYLGKIVEEAAPKALFSNPQHPYTRALLDSIPTLDRNKRPKQLKGEIPSNVESIGCGFNGRCHLATEKCRSEAPILSPVGNGRVSCFFPIGDSKQTKKTS